MFDDILSRKCHISDKLPPAKKNRLKVTNFRIFLVGQKIVTNILGKWLIF